jgi:molecular chaperone GrpE
MAEEPVVPSQGAGETPPEPGAAAPGGTSGAEPRANAGAQPETDYKDRWLRAEAELQNFRRRSQRDLEEALRFAEERVLLEMVSVLDDLERALETAREAGAPDPWVQGVQLVASRMIDYLARQRVVPMNPLGHPFDPEFHEALLEVDPPEDMAPGAVVQVVRKGYQRDQRALRAARVVVARRVPAGES